jgi:hypothetical protein
MKTYLDFITEDDDSNHIIMQLRKADSLGGNDVEFKDGKKHKISKPLAKKALSKYNNLTKPNEKREFQAKLAKSLGDFKQVLNESLEISVGSLQRTIKTPHGNVVTVHHRETPYDALYKEEWYFLLNKEKIMYRALSRHDVKKGLSMIDRISKRAEDREDEIDSLEILNHLIK